MAKNLDGNSLFTSDVIILIYYACALISLCTGALALVALIGAIISRIIAKKEGSVLVAKHCSWITNSILALLIAVIVVICGVIAYLGTADMTTVEIINFTDIDPTLDDPALQNVLVSIFVGLIAMLPVVFWYVYRIVRGVLSVLRAKAPK